MKLPLTREDFETLVETTTSQRGLPYNDDMRVMAISYFHSLGRETCDFDPEKLANYLYTAVSHDMTYHIGQDIHKKRLDEQKKKEEPKLTIVEPV